MKIFAHRKDWGLRNIGTHINISQNEKFHLAINTTLVLNSELCLLRIPFIINKLIFTSQVPVLILGYIIFLLMRLK